jgi:ParB-like chromosome segregation protein Spo0J
VSGQLTLLPTEAPEVRRESLSLELIDGFADASPSAKLRELIRDLGLLQPIVVVPSRSGRFRIVEGRRRCKAIAQLADADEWPAPAQIDALVLGGRQTGRREVRGGLTLALHASRSASPASELAAIEAILEADGDASEAATVKEIAAQTAISVQTVRRRLRLRALTPGLRAAFDRGTLAASVAEAAARLPAAQQERLERKLEEGTRLSHAEVREVGRAHANAASAELPDGLFAEQGAFWQTTVRGHLASALAAIPPGEPHAALRDKITGALATADRL